MGLPAPLTPLSGDPGPAASLLGLEPDQFERMGFEDEQAGWVLGHKLPVDRIYRIVRPCCPDCLAEDAYYRRIDLRQLDVCPVHSRQLLKLCAECGGQIRWTNVWSHTFCGCGARLDRPGLSPIADDCSGARAVYLHCGLPLDGEHGRLPKAFKGLSLGPLLDLLFFLGRMDVVIARDNPDGLEPREMLVHRSILNAGTQIALKWPGSFEALANSVRDARSEGGGLQNQYGYLHRFIMRSGAEPYGDLLRNAYAAHLARRGDIPERSWPVGLSVPTGTVRAVTVLEAQKMFGLGASSFATLRQQSLWSEMVPVLSTRNGSAQYAWDDIEKLRAKLSRMHSPGVADLKLGLGRGRTDLLVQAGLVPVLHWNRHHRNREQRSVDLADVDALFGRIRGLARKTAPARPVTFDSLVAMADRRGGLSYLDVIRCLLSGQLRAHLVDPEIPAPKGLSFERAEAEDILNRLGAPDKTGKIVLGDVKRRLGISAASVHKLVAEGFLPKPQRFSGFVFDLAAIVKFQKEFTNDRLLARKQRTKPDLVRAAVKLLGIQPVTTVSAKTGSIAHVYRKSDLGPM